MDFSLTIEQQMIKEAARELAEMELSMRAEEIDSLNLFPVDGIRSLSDSELMGMLLPSSYGGSGSEPLSFALVTSEIARSSASLALIFVTHVASSYGLFLGGTEGLKARLLPSLAKGDKLAAFAATEADSGATVLAIRTTGKLEADKYIVNGSKTFITSGDEASVYLTVVKTRADNSPSSLSLLAIEKDMEGLSTGKKFLRMGLNGTSSSEIFFSDTAVPGDNRLGQEGGYLPLSFPIAGLGMLGVSAIAEGMVSLALEKCLAHARERKIGGQPLGNYQGVQFLLSEISYEVEAIRTLLYKVASEFQPVPGTPPLAVYKLKLFATETALRVLDKALQVHGGQGYTRELILERLYRDARGLTLHFGPTEPLKETLGKALLIS